MRSRLLGGQVSSRLYAVGSGGASDRVSHRASNRSSRKRSGSLFGAILTIGILVLIALAVRASLPAAALLPDISAKSAIALDLDSGKELLSKDADARVYPASLTKLMTALILADHRMPSDLLRCSEAASQQESYNLGMPPGATMTAAAAIDAMLVGSANDVAYMVAEDVGEGSTTGFAALMNSKAKDLGMRDTNFVTPNGLHDEDHYSTARDLATLLQAALEDPWVASSLAKKETTVKVSAPPDGPATPAGTVPRAIVVMGNTNPLLRKDGCTAGKTGSTSEAGKCLAALFERDGRRIIAVVMGAPGSEALVEDMRAVVEAALRR